MEKHQSIKWLGRRKTRTEKDLLNAHTNDNANGNNSGHVRVYEIKEVSNLSWKNTGTHYLRYKATDASGNETPNNANYYLTINVGNIIFNGGIFDNDGINTLITSVGEIFNPTYSSHQLVQ